MSEMLFDRLARTVGEGVSRRGVVRAVVGGAITLGLSHLTVDDAHARTHGKHHRKRRRKRTLTTTLASTTCVPQDPAVVCTAGCGTRSNNCGQAITCPCPAGQVCLPNGSCAVPCSSTAPCSGACFCPQADFVNAEGRRLCVAIGVNTCGSVPTCRSTSQCPVGTECAPCATPTDLRCIPLCQG